MEINANKVFDAHESRHLIRSGGFLTNYCNILFSFPQNVTYIYNKNLFLTRNQILNYTCKQKILLTAIRSQGKAEIFQQHSHFIPYLTYDRTYHLYAYQTYV